MPTSGFFRRCWIFWRKADFVLSIGARWFHKDALWIGCSCGFTKEKRQSEREDSVSRGVQCRTELADGTVLDGLVADVSLRGARIRGSVLGVRVGDEVRLIFVFPTREKVGYRGIVKHMEPQLTGFGVEFTSDPEPIEVLEQ